MKNYDKISESSYIEYLDANNSYGQAMPQKLPVKGFKRLKQKKLSKSRKTHLQHRKQGKICFSQKSFKTSIKLWFDTKKGTQNNSV